MAKSKLQERYYLSDNFRDCKFKPTRNFVKFTREVIEYVHEVLAGLQTPKKYPIILKSNDNRYCIKLSKRLVEPTNSKDLLRGNLTTHLIEININKAKYYSKDFLQFLIYWSVPAVMGKSQVECDAMIFNYFKTRKVGSTFKKVLIEYMKLNSKHATEFNLKRAEQIVKMFLRDKPKNPTITVDAEPKKTKAKRSPRVKN